MAEIGLMLTDAVHGQLWKIAAPYHPRNDQAHGRSRVERVLKSAKEIGKRAGANLGIIEVATILHDMFVSKETDSNIEGFQAGEGNEKTPLIANSITSLRIQARCLG